MFNDILNQLIPLAATDDVGFLAGLVLQIWVLVRVALGIGLVIFVHELGHFVAAKTFGVKCEKFYVGFDVPIRIGPIKFPRTLGKFQYGETEYGIGIIPLGGYVKMLGQDDDPRKAEQEAKRIRVAKDSNELDDEIAADTAQLDPRSYPAKAVWQRMIIISAGVVMNLITGVIFAAIAYGYGVTYNPAIIGGVTPGGPAWQAGVEPGGQVISVGNLKQDDQMHFREMRMAILTEGIDQPDAPLDLAIRYDDGVRKYKLKTVANPENQDIRMIGIAPPTSLKFDSELYAKPGSVAATVLTEEDANSTIVAYDGINVKTDSIVPATPFFDYLYTHPSKAISLTLARADGTEHSVELPPQPAKMLGFEWALSPINAIVDGGAAAKAGLQVGDVILEINGNADIDAYLLPLEFTALNKNLAMKVRRGEGDNAREIEVEIAPQKSLQTLEPASGITSEVALNSFGFSYRVIPVVASVLAPLATANVDENKELQAGDAIQEIRLTASDSELPAELKKERLVPIVELLREGWKVDGPISLGNLVEFIQVLPEGTPLQVLATRQSTGMVIETTVAVQQSERVWYDRGLGLTPSESIQTATSVMSALSLGVIEAERRLKDVFRFLSMLPKGRVKLRHVGGPLEIMRMAKQETERGISAQLLFLTMLSMNLAILNFLPIPALDGGHMMFLIAEAIRGKRLDEQLEMRLTMAGVLTILLLMVVVFANDILRWL